ncbi:MAG: hypothetical protein ACI4K5_05795 [Ruminococcus sp.]
MNNNSIFIDSWCYTKPDLVPNTDGDIVIIKKLSFGPLEIYLWGIDSNNTPYELYEWVENDFYADTNYRKNISKEELLNQINSVISLFANNELSEWATIYKKIFERLNFTL